MPTISQKYDKVTMHLTDDGFFVYFQRDLRGVYRPVVVSGSGRGLYFSLLPNSNLMVEADVMAAEYFGSPAGGWPKAAKGT